MPYMEKAQVGQSHTASVEIYNGQRPDDLKLVTFTTGGCATPSVTSDMLDDLSPCLTHAPSLAPPPLYLCRS